MKKILAILISVLLIMSVGTLAFAKPDYATEGEIAALTDASTVTIKKAYRLIGAGTSPEETFTLTQTGSSVVDGEATAAPALVALTGDGIPANAVAQVAFAAGDAKAEPSAENGAIKNFTVTLPEYTSVGIYEYTLKEVAGTTAGVTYYANDIKLIVTVINDDEGNLRVAAVHTEDLADEDAAKSDTFENTYSAAELDIKKEVTGNLGDKDKYFDFTVTLTGETGKTYAESYAVTGGSTEANNPTSIVIGTPTVFKLKHDDTIRIPNLPTGVTYTVTEADYTAEADGGYDAPVIKDAADAVSDGEGTIATETLLEKFINNKGTLVDTGVFVDNLPYVIIMAAVIVAGLAMMVLKRRNREIA